MARKNKFLKAKRLKHLLQLKFLKADKDYHKEVFDEALTFFLVELKKFQEKHDLDLKIVDNRSSESPNCPPESGKTTDIVLYEGNELVEEDETGRYITSSAKNVLDEEVKKLYKKIATNTHPDRLPIYMMPDEVRWKTSLFVRATSAADKNDWIELYEIAQELNLILPPATKEQIDMIAKQCDSLKAFVHNKKSTYAWILFHCDDDDEVDNWLKKYVQAVKGITID